MLKSLKRERRPHRHQLCMISLEKFLQEKKINFTNVGESKLNLESESSVFNLNCINASEFPLTDEDFNENEFLLIPKTYLNC